MERFGRTRSFGRSSAAIAAGIALSGMILVGGCATGQKQAQREGNAQAHYKFGISYLNEGELQPAFVEFQKAVDLNPRDKSIHYALGYLYDRMERYADAVVSYRKSLAIDPDFAEAHNALGVVYAEMLQWDDAVAEYRKALSNPRYLTPQRAHFNLGRAYFNTENFPAALTAFQDAVKVQPEEGLFHFWMGKTQEKLGRPREALTAYREAVQRMPESGEIRYALGEAYLKGGQKEEAVREFKKVVELSPDTERAENSIRYLESLQ